MNKTFENLVKIHNLLAKNISREELDKLKADKLFGARNNAWETTYSLNIEEYWTKGLVSGIDYVERDLKNLIAKKIKEKVHAYADNQIRNHPLSLKLKLTSLSVKGQKKVVAIADEEEEEEIEDAEEAKTTSTGLIERIEEVMKDQLTEKPSSKDYRELTTLCNDLFDAEVESVYRTYKEFEKTLSAIKTQFKNGSEFIVKDLTETLTNARNIISKGFKFKLDISNEDLVNIIENFADVALTKNVVVEFSEDEQVWKVYFLTKFKRTFQIWNAYILEEDAKIDAILKLKDGKAFFGKIKFWNPGEGPQTISVWPYDEEMENW